MASIRKTKRPATGWLMLFALPFAAVGVGALGWAGITLLDWHEARRWIPAPAVVEEVELVEKRGDDATTYEATATYVYEYAGQRYSGTRVAIDSGADNIGDFQHRLYREIKAAQQHGKPVTAYVDPDDPRRAVLNRELRTGLLALKGVFGLLFGSVGFGLLFGARYVSKKAAAEDALRARFPNEPWRWRPEWANGRIAASSRAWAYVALAFAALWNLISLPLVFQLPGEIARGNAAAAVGLLFPLVGAGLAAWAIRAWLQLKRFKVPVLTLSRMPVAPGGRLKGTIRVEALVPITSDFRLGLECVEQRTRGTGKNRRREEKLLWQKQWRVPRHQFQIGAQHTTIPVDTAVPADQPATTTENGDRIFWRLEAIGACPGPDFHSRFELPVFATGEQPEPPGAAAAAFEQPRVARPDARTLEALGIEHERLPQGGEAWTFRRARHKGLAAGVSAFAAAWAAGSAGLFVADASIVLPIVFAVFDAIFVWWALSLWLTEWRVTLDRGLLTLTRRGLLARAPIEIPQPWLRGIHAKRGMQAGNKLYYDLVFETADGAHTASVALPDYDVASWLAQQWMAHGARA